jgi:hypothetical protein
VLVRKVNDCVGGFGAGPDAPEVVEVTAPDVRSLCPQRSRGGVRPGQARDLVMGGEQFIDGSGANPPRGPGDEYARGAVSPQLRQGRSRLMYE